jgi:hypothetical protein
MTRRQPYAFGSLVEFLTEDCGPFFSLAAGWSRGTIGVVLAEQDGEILIAWMDGDRPVMRHFKPEEIRPAAGESSRRGRPRKHEEEEE